MQNQTPNNNPRKKGIGSVFNKARLAQAKVSPQELSAHGLKSFYRWDGTPKGIGLYKPKQGNWYLRAEYKRGCVTHVYYRQLLDLEDHAKSYREFATHVARMIPLDAMELKFLMSAWYNIAERYSFYKNK